MRRRKSAIFFLILGICLVALAVALNVGWIFTVQQIALLVLGIIFFALIITGLILNMIFLIREIRKNEQQNAFLNAMTHELKTPIASIKLYLETLKARDVTEAKREEFYDIMLADSDRLFNTVEQVLQASRTKEKGRGLNMAKVEIEELLNECAELVRTRHKLEDEAIRVYNVPPETYVSGDVAELKTIFSNLLDNAIKYSKDEINISIKTRVYLNKFIEIHIRDKGVGIARSELKNVFKRFYRIPNSSTQVAKGTGLGLYIVKSILKKHRGKISVNSNGVGKGTTFTVRLPKV